LCLSIISKTYMASSNSCTVANLRSSSKIAALRVQTCAEFGKAIYSFSQVIEIRSLIVILECRYKRFAPSIYSWYLFQFSAVGLPIFSFLIQDASILCVKNLTGVYKSMRFFVFARKSYNIVKHDKMKKKICIIWA
jgi:hypothetical protein